MRNKSILQGIEAQSPDLQQVAAWRFSCSRYLPVPPFEPHSFQCKIKRSLVQSSRDSSVGVVTALWHRRESAHTGPGSHLASCVSGYRRIFFWGVMQPGLETLHSRSTNAEGKNVLSYTSTPSACTSSTGGNNLYHPLEFAQLWNALLTLVQLFLLIMKNYIVVYVVTFILLRVIYI